MLYLHVVTECVKISFIPCLLFEIMFSGGFPLLNINSNLMASVILRLQFNGFIA